MLILGTDPRDTHHVLLWQQSAGLSVGAFVLFGFPFALLMSPGPFGTVVEGEAGFTALCFNPEVTVHMRKLPRTEHITQEESPWLSLSPLSSLVVSHSKYLGKC